MNDVRQSHVLIAIMQQIGFQSLKTALSCDIAVVNNIISTCMNDDRVRSQLCCIILNDVNNSSNVSTSLQYFQFSRGFLLDIITAHLFWHRACQNCDFILHLVCYTVRLEFAGLLHAPSLLPLPHRCLLVQRDARLRVCSCVVRILVWLTCV